MIITKNYLVTYIFKNICNYMYVNIVYILKYECVGDVCLCPFFLNFRVFGESLLCAIGLWRFRSEPGRHAA